MPSIAHLTDAVETLIVESGSDLPRAARQRLVFFVLGVLLAGSIALRRVATPPANIAVGATKAASHERRLRRIINDPLLGQAAPMYGRVVRRVLRRLPPTQRLWLIIDERGHRDVVRGLVAALWYRGRAVPTAEGRRCTILLANPGTRATGPHAGGTPTHPARETRRLLAGSLHKPWFA